MKYYHNLYWKCDVLVSFGAFEKLRKNSLKNGLSPSHYLSAPGLSWDAILKKKQKLSLNLFQILTCIYSLIKLQKGGFLIFLTDAAKPKINIWKLIVRDKNQNALYT